MSIDVQLEVYEGPLDLLLHLIKKNEVGIADIPISVITNQYLATLELMRSLNLDIAGEYLVMASTLIHIKSRELLPLEEGGEDEDEEEDTRDELIHRLLDYQRYKEAASELEGRELLHRDVFVRLSESRQELEAAEFERVSLFDLMSAFQRVLERLPKEGVHMVTVEKISVQEKMNLILDCLRRSTRMVFQSLFEGAVSRMEIIATFLALLELIKIRAIRAIQDERVGPIMIELTAPVVEEQEGLVNGETEEGGEHGA
jgi:segregation and condensation protein A